ncbi:MAG: helix-turn-helix domain-containing protein [Saprospiraceae bacterium]
MMEHTSERASAILKFINQTNQSIFLTGKAGTGKTTLLKKIIQTTHKNTVVVAPTGIAALNAGGVTIHSMFQLPLGGFVPDISFSVDLNDGVKLESIASLSRTFKMSGVKQAVIRSMDLLIIDEVSMLRADVLDAIDFVMRRVRRKDQPFGGVQVLYIGDLLQLPPVVKNDEWRVLQNYYPGMFFFHSKVIRQHPILYIELKKIYRQTDDRFINVLNNLRNNIVQEEDIQILSAYVKPDFDMQKNPGYIFLTTHNHKADQINKKSLDHLKEKIYSFKAEIEGEFPDKMYPMDEVLHLKVGAQIMFTKNDLSQEKRFFNGKMGVVTSLSKDEIFVHFLEDNLTIEVEKYEWTNVKYRINEDTKDVEEEVIGTFVHYPIKLAWAITVHKSQGLTFDKAVLDVGDVFQPGQAYVALSRLRSMDGLVLVDMLKMHGIRNAQDVVSYAENEADDDTIQKHLKYGTKSFIYQYIKKSFDVSFVVDQWQKHDASYADHAVNSEKTKHRSWANTQYMALNGLSDVSKKFLGWIDLQFSANEVDIGGIALKLNGAYEYFFPKLDPVLDELLTKIEELKKVKRVKEYFNELMTLEASTTLMILGMKKATLLVDAYANNKEINNENLSDHFVKNYRAQKMDLIKEKVRSTKKHTIIEEEEMEDFSYYVKKPKKSKENKISTYQITHDLWLQKKSMEDIAFERKLTLNTIQGHMARLIQEDKIFISEVMTDDKLGALHVLFADFTGGSLGEMKEKAGEEFSFGELKIFRASLKQL